jgi:hypothetical protein
MVVEVVIPAGGRQEPPPAVKLFGGAYAPQDILFAFYEAEPNLPRFPVASIRRDPTADA